MSNTIVSVIIISRAKDDLSGLLRDIETQQLSCQTEVITIIGIAPPGKARNEGAKKAKGEILAFLDSDIRLGDDLYLANLVKALAVDPAPGAACASLRLPPQTSAFQKCYAREIAHNETPVVDVMTEVYVVPSACFAIQAEVFTKLGGFNEAMIRGEDSELTARIRKAGYRTVLAPQTWCLHPCPDNFWQLARTNIRNGAGVAFVDTRYPQLNSDIHPAGITHYSAPKTRPERALRFFRTGIKAFSQGKILLVSAKFYYALGYSYGLVKYKVLKEKGVLAFNMRFKDKLFDLVQASGPGYILDLGCGSGTDLERIALTGRGDRIYGLDNSAVSLAEAKTRLAGRPGCYLVQARGEAIPFRDNSFDIAISSEVIEHTPQPLVYFSEAARILKDDGVLIVTTPSKYNYITLIGKSVPASLKKVLRRAVYAVAPGKDINPHFREYTPREMKIMLQSQGFIVEKLIPGVMRVPAWQLFDKVPLLLVCWKGIDLLLGTLPFGRHLKANYIMVAKKLAKAKSKILIINLGGLGDVLLSVPALQALRRRYAGSEISFLVSARNYDFAQSLAIADRVYKFYLEYGGTIPGGKIARDIGTVNSFRRRKFDLAVNMRTLASHQSARKMKLLLALINPRVKAGRDTAGRGDFFDIKIPETDPGQSYEMDYDIATAAALGATVTNKKITLKIDEQARQTMNQVLARENITAADILIGIHPGGLLSRRWPKERFRQVIEELRQRVTCKFVLTGSKDEFRLAEDLAGANKSQIINLAGKLTILELEALVERCRIFLTNDTGPMHLAAVLNTPLVAILGPGEIIRFDPRNISDQAVALYHKADCAPCSKKECASLKCLQAITVTDVVAAVIDLHQKTERR